MPESVRMDDLERGRRAYAHRRWAEAFAALSLADQRRPLDAPDLRALAWAALLVGRNDDFAAAMERAHRDLVAASDLRAAARCALWLCFVLGRQGDTGPASGWLERARRLLGSDESRGAEGGYLLLPELMGHASAGAWSAVHAVATRAATLGQRFADADLTAFARHWQGRALVRLGRPADGLALIDESMISVTADALSPFVTGVLYCSVIEACQEIADVGRSQQWTRAFSRWCDDHADLVAFSGQCLVHRAELTALRGGWQDAADQASRAAVVAAASDDQPAATAAVYLQGEIHRLRGALTAAVERFQLASRWGRDPQPGLALVRLAQGDVTAAAAGIRRACDETADPLDRARLLPARVEIAVAAHDVDEARGACRELADTATTWGTTALAALASGADAVAELAGGDPRVALRSARRAATAWQELQAPYELARARVTAGRACGAVGDHDAARLELAAAREAFARLGAARDLAQLGRDGVSPRAGDVPLTEREHQILRLIPQGHTNKAIAAELFVSEKTVERHVSHILAKLGVPSRAAATAVAHEHGLL